MKEFKALVLCHYDFTNDKGRRYTGTKYLVSLGCFGSVEANGNLNNKLNILEEVTVKLTYKDNKFRVVE